MRGKPSPAAQPRDPVPADPLEQMLARLASGDDVKIAGWAAKLLDRGESAAGQPAGRPFNIKPDEADREI